MKAYYNEWDLKIAGWLRELITQGLIADGDVDTRSIKDVRSSDLVGYSQHHFFAGIGGWSYALRLAGWPDNRPVWTGSCPCQPFSISGRQKGEADSRHLWPEFLRLIGEYQPASVLGEQVASRLGREWLSRVRANLEALDYAVGAADLCAAGVGAPHIRSRLYWVANTNKAGRIDPVAWSPFAWRDGSGAADMASGTSMWLGEREPHRLQDGSSRRSKSCVGILVNGFPGRVATVGGFGNAIVPQLAAKFIKAAF